MRQVTREQARKLAEALRAQGKSADAIRQALSTKIQITDKPAPQPARENEVNSDRGFGEFNGFLDNPIVEGLGTALDFVGGAARTGALNIAEENARPVISLAAAAARKLAPESGFAKEATRLADTNIVSAGDIKDAFNPFDRKDAIDSSEILRRTLDVQPKEGEIEGTDLAGFVGDTVLDPLSYLTLGALPVAKVAGKGLKQIPRLLGRLTGASGEVVDNFVKKNKKFRKLAKLTTDELASDQSLKLKEVIETIDNAQFERTKKLRKQYGDKIASKKSVDVKKFKDSLKDLKKEFDPTEAITDSDLSESLEVTKLVDGFISKGGKEVADSITGTKASKLLKGLEGQRSVSIDATSAQKRVAAAVNRAAKTLSNDLVGKKLAKQYSVEVIDRAKTLKRLTGDAIKTDSAGRIGKLQTTFKSGTRADNRALRTTLNQLGEFVGKDLTGEALDARTLDILGNSTGRLSEALSGGRLISNAARVVVEPAFKGSAAAASKVGDSGALNALLQRLLIDGADSN